MLKYRPANLSDLPAMMSLILPSTESAYPRSIRAKDWPEASSPIPKPLQKALAKNGYAFCGKITLCSGSEAGDPRFAYQKILT